MMLWFRYHEDYELKCAEIKFHCCQLEMDGNGLKFLFQSWTRWLKKNRLKSNIDGLSC